MEENRLRMAIQRADDGLLDGEKRFRCTMEGERLMERVVGAHDEHHARAKYIAFFGINAILDPQKQLAVAPAEQEVSA